MIEIR